MALLEPFVIPGFDRVVLKLLIIFSFIIVTGIVVTVGSIIGVIRAVRRHRGDHSKGAVIIAATAAAITISWLLYWVGSDIADRSNPINGLLGINFDLCVLPLSWLVAALRANVVWRKGME